MYVCEDSAAPAHARTTQIDELYYPHLFAWCLVPDIRGPILDRLSTDTTATEAVNESGAASRKGGGAGGR